MQWLDKRAAAPKARKRRITPESEVFLTQVAYLLSLQPWLERFLCSWRAVTPIPSAEQWHVIDSNGDALPLMGEAHWRLFALSSGAPLDVVGECLRPFGAFINNRYYALEAEK